MLNEIKSWLGIFLVLLILSGGCSVAEVTLNASNDGGQQTLARGQAVVVTLDSNATTGYSWVVADVDNNVLRQVGDPVYASSNSNPKVLGAGGAQTFRFEVASAGTTTLKMVYRRPWETGVAPIKTFTVQVAVR
jgi:inhibitor of cysteine peptidase